MEHRESVYIAIDLKSFYASVECRKRGLDPMKTNLVVADAERTEKTICLAVSPSLKAYGIPGRARLFEVVQAVREENERRKNAAPGHTFSGSSWDDEELKACPDLELTYITAPPRMACYIQESAKIYEVYLKYIAPEDIHVYSVDEVFMNVTEYLETYGLKPRQLAARMIQDVYETTGITSTAGIGTNLYLCKVALDIVSKHIPPDGDGVRIAQLNEREYRRLLWNHKPLTDFWRIGTGYARKLEANGLYTMGDIARCSLGKTEDYYNEDLLYRLFGVNAELLIDHAWGWESCTISDIKRYQPERKSMVSGQVLSCPYEAKKARMVVGEMADALALELVEKKLVTGQLVLTVGYDIENLTDPERAQTYGGEVVTDSYGRRVPKHAHGTVNLKERTSSSRLITDSVFALYDRLVNPALLIRRLSLAAEKVEAEENRQSEPSFVQLDLFTDYKAQEEQRNRENVRLQRERKLQEAMLDIKKRFGKNAVLKGVNLMEGATAIERNRQIGGHKA